VLAFTRSETQAGDQSKHCYAQNTEKIPIARARVQARENSGGFSECLVL
jgi:hypothetical protein